MVHILHLAAFPPYGNTINSSDPYLSEGGIWGTCLSSVPNELRDSHPTVLVLWVCFSPVKSET